MLSNAERHCINRLKLIEYAKLHRVPIIRWRRPIIDGVIDATYRHTPCDYAMEAHMRDLSTALGFSSHVGVTTWSQRNFGTLYMVTSPAYQALL